MFGIIIENKEKKMQVIRVKSDGQRIKLARKLIKSAGNNIGNLWFHKRSDGKLRKMSFRIGVTHPSYAKIPTGKKLHKDSDYNLITLFDTNAVNYNRAGTKMTGRGAWKSVPLDKIIRVSVGGTIHKIIS